MEEYYKVLGVNKNTSDSELTNVLRKLLTQENINDNDVKKYVNAYNVLVNRKRYAIKKQRSDNEYVFPNKNTNFIYSKSIQSSTVNMNGNEVTKKIKEVNKNGKIFREEVEIVGNNKTIKRQYPDGTVKTFS